MDNDHTDQFPPFHKPLAQRVMGSILSAAALVFAIAGEAQAGCEMTPTSALEVRRALMNPNPEKLPSSICLPKLPKEIDDQLSISRNLGSFAGDPKTQAEDRKRERNGEMGGSIEFTYGEMFNAMVSAILDAGSPKLKSTAASAVAHIVERREHYRELDSKADRSESEEAEFEKLKNEVRKAREFLFDVIARLKPVELSTLMAAVPAGDLNLQTAIFPRGAWHPGTRHTGKAPRITSKHPLTAVGMFHTHPADSSHFHSPGDVSNNHHFSDSPMNLGSFVMHEGTRKMTWMAPSAPFAAAKKSRGEGWKLSNGYQALCESLRRAELHDGKSAGIASIWLEATGDCIVWASEMQGNAFYEADNDAGEFRRRPLSTNSPVIAMLAGNLPDAPQSAQAYPAIFLKNLLKFIALNEGLYESGETPQKISEPRTQTILNALWETYVGESHAETNLGPSDMQRLLLAIADAQSPHSYNQGELVVCRGGTRWLRSATTQPSVRPCIGLHTTAWNSLPWSGKGTLSLEFGDYASEYDEQTDLFYPKLKRKDVAFALSMNDGRIAESTLGEKSTVEQFAAENEDWGVAPTKQLTNPIETNDPTPTSIPGGRVIRTLELKAMLETRRDALVIDVLNGRSIPGALSMPLAGDVYPGIPKVTNRISQKFFLALGKVSGQKKERPLVFLCSSAECWHSYNAALRAIAAGYRNVYWYRGGLAAWRSAGFKWELSKEVEFVSVEELKSLMK